MSLSVHDGNENAKGIKLKQYIMLHGALKTYDSPKQKRKIATLIRFLASYISIYSIQCYLGYSHCSWYINGFYRGPEFVLEKYCSSSSSIQNTFFLAKFVPGQ